MLRTEEVRDRWYNSSTINPRIVEFLESHATHSAPGQCTHYLLYMYWVTLGFVPERHTQRISTMLAQWN